MTNGQQDARLRDAMPTELPVPTAVSQRMLAAIAAEADHPARGDELEARRRRSSGVRWLLGVAATTLLLAVGLAVSGPQGGPTEQDALGSVAEMDQVSGSAATTAGSAPESTAEDSIAADSQLAKGSAGEVVPMTLTAETIVGYVRQILSSRDETRAALSLPGQCAVAIGRTDPPTISTSVDFEGMPGLLVVFGERDRFAIWVVAPDCAPTGSGILYHSEFPVVAR